MNTIWDDFDGKPRRKTQREMGYEQGFADAKAQYEPKWIPVSEGLPEDDARVLITTTSALGTERIVLEVSYLNGVFIRGFSSYTPPAWMPLPKPYKEGE